MGGSKVFSFADRNNSQLKIFSTTSERLKIKQPWKSKTFACSFLFFRHFGWPGHLSSGQHHLAKKQKQSHFPHHRQPCQATLGRSKSTWRQHKLPTNRSRDKQSLSAADSAETAVRYPNKVYPSSSIAGMTLSVNPSVRQYVHCHVNRHHDVVCKSFCYSVRQYVHHHVNRHHDVCKSFCQTIMYTLPCKLTL